MSSPYQQPDFLESITRGLQVRQMVEDIKHRREARQQQAELYRLQIEDRQHNRAAQDFKTTMLLQEMGALPVQPGTTGKFEAGLGGRATVDAPTGQQYSLPTPSQKFERAQTLAQQKGTLEGVEASAKAQGIEEEGKRSGRLIEAMIPAMGDQPAVRLFIPREKAAEHRKTVRELQAGKFSKSEFKTDPQTGKTYFFGIDADTNEPVERELGTTMTPTPAGAGKEPLPSNADIEGLMNKWRQNLYNSRGITQEVLDAAQGMGESDGFGGPKSNPAAARVREAEKELRDAAEQEVKARIRNSGAQTKSAAVAGKKEPVKASKLSSLLQDPRVKARGIRDLNALRKDLVKNGYSIDEQN